MTKAYDQAKDFLKKLGNPKWKLSGYAGQHDEAGGVIKNRGQIVASTYGGLTSVSSPKDWERYYATAEFVAAAPELVKTLLDEIDTWRALTNA